jgi:dipeptidase D
MVCEANSDSAHDFDADPITLRLDGGWLRANGTTLGADNGVGGWPRRRAPCADGARPW